MGQIRKYNTNGGAGCQVYQVYMTDTTRHFPVCFLLRSDTEHQKIQVLLCTLANLYGNYGY
jgi:hypothetical protein